MAEQTRDASEVTDSTGTTARPAENPGIDPEDVQQSSAVEADAEVADPDGNERADDADGDVLTVAPIGQTGVVAGGTTVARP